MRFRGVFAGAVVLAATAFGGTGAAQAQGPTVTVGADGKTAPVFSYAEATRERVWYPRSPASTPTATA